MKKNKLKSLEALEMLNSRQILSTKGILKDDQDTEKIIGLNLELSTLSEEELQQIEALIPKYQYVQKVIIEKLRYVPDSIFALPYLQVLSLSCEQSTDGAVLDFKDGNVLRKITLRNFTSLPSSIYERSPKLEELWLKYCTIDEVPDSIEQLKELRNLMFEQCKIKKVSSNVFALPQLKDLDLRSSSIEEITPLTNPVQSSKLKEINLSYNLLQSFPTGLLQYLPNLKELYCIDNKITEVPEEDINGKSFEKIDLSKNVLQVFPSFILEQVKKITFLVLEHNQIKEIPENILALARQKKCFVKLDDNLIEAISEAVEKDLQKHEEHSYPPPRVTVKNNPCLIQKERQQQTAYQLLRETQSKEGTCVQIGNDEYEGTGVLPQEHPLKNRISFRQQCTQCKSKNIFITYAKFTVHLMGGDVYWDYNYHCNNCGAKDSSSYAEND